MRTIGKVFVALGLVALSVLAMSAGWRGAAIGPYQRGATVAMGHLYWDRMDPAAATGSYIAGDSLAVKRGGVFVPISQVDVIYWGAGTDSVELEYNWSTSTALTTAETFKVKCNNTTMVVYPPLKIRADFVRVKPLSGSDASDWTIVAYGVR